MRQAKLAAILSVLGALALLVAACAPAATPTPTATPTPPPGVATPTPAPGVATPTPTGEATPTPTPVVEQPQYGGELRQATGADIVGFDSHRNTSSTYLTSTALIFNQLVRFDPTKETVKWEDLQGDLAERWEVSADGLVYTFYLRQGVKWHDGAPFTSADVVHSLNKLTDPKRSVHAGKLAAFNRAEAIDEHTVKVYFKFPQASFLPMLGAGFFHMQSKHLAEVSYRTTAFAIGTGPFKLKSLSPGVEVLFEKNPDYFLKGLPYADGMRLYGLASAALVGPFVSKQTDYIQGGSITDVQKAQLDMLAPGYKIKFVPSFTWRGVYFNWEREGPWQDVRVRRAMALTFDFPGSIIAATGGPEYQQNGAAFPPPPVTPWGLTWEEAAKRWGIDRPMEERLAQAKRLMADAGYPNGFKGTFLTRSPSQSYLTVSLFVADLWKRYLNIDLTVVGLASGPFFERRDAMMWDILWEGIAYSLGDPDEILAQTYRTGSPDNFSRYTNPYIDELADKILRESDIEKRKALAYAAQRAIIDDVATIVPAWHAYSYLWQDWVKGVVIQPGYSRQTILPYFWLDQKHPQYPRGR